MVDKGHNGGGKGLLHGKGVAKDEEGAMQWFRRAADQGHAHASYNLAVGHRGRYTSSSSEDTLNVMAKINLDLLRAL